MGQRSIFPSDRAEIDAVTALLQASHAAMKARLAEMEDAIASRRFNHFIDLVEQGREAEAIARYGDLADDIGGVDADFDEALS